LGEPESQLAEKKPIWSVVNEGIRAGQRHERAKDSRDAVGFVLETDAVPGLHAGIHRIVHKLRLKNARVLQRLGMQNNFQLTHTTLSAYFTEMTWKLLQETRGSNPPFTRNFYNAFLTIAQDSKKDMFTSKAQAIDEDAFGRMQQRLSREEQFQTGVQAEVNTVSELTKVLATRYAWDASDWKDKLKGNAESELSGIADRSVLAILNAFSSLSSGLHTNIVLQSAHKEERPLGKYQRPTQRQDPSSYEFIQDKATARVLTPRLDMYPFIHGPIVSFGCPAKYAVAGKGKSVANEFGEQLLTYWKKHVLPELVVDAKGRVLSSDGIARYKEKHATLV
jgi:hypothetical protein